MRQYFSGVSRALNHGSFRPDGAPIGATTRYEVLMTLVKHEDAVNKCKSVVQLHRWLVEKLASSAPDYKTLEKICQEIRLKLARRGKPSRLR